MMTDTSPLMGTVSDLIKDSTREVFRTIFEIDAESIGFEDIRGRPETFIAGSVGFVGDANGLVYVYFRAAFAQTLASRMLSMPESEMDDEMVDDVVGELSNMIVGSVKSTLCDSGFPCKLTTPSIVRGQNLKAQSLRPSESLLLTMRCDNEPILLELILTPAN